MVTITLDPWTRPRPRGKEPDTSGDADSTAILSPWRGQYLFLLEQTFILDTDIYSVGLNCVPQNLYVVPLNVTVFENRAFKTLIKLRLLG